MGLTRKARSMLAIGSISALSLFGLNANAAPTVSFILGADDYAEIYLSTDDAEQGSLIGATSFFSGLLQTITGDLTPGVTNYIHVLVQNGGGPFTMAGEFTLLGQGFEFSNGTQFLSTQTSNVSMSLTGFGENYEAPLLFGVMTDYGAYYSDQYTAPSVTQNIGGNDTAYSYFSIPVYAVASVPEPDSIAMLFAGLCLLGAVANRRQKS